jgi:hypothetical protein
MEIEGMLTGLQKFAEHQSHERASSPKLQVLNTALITAQSRLTFEEARKDREFWGRLVESAVGAHLLNTAAVMLARQFLGEAQPRQEQGRGSARPWQKRETRPWERRDRGPQGGASSDDE